jgi:two-component system, OmpR family, phosphate regulon sensor histidine kinase PhoR
MTGRPDFPWPALTLAAISAAAIPFAGGSLWLAAAIFAVWAGSLFLIRQEPPPRDGSAGPIFANARDGLREVIEPLDVPVVMFERDRIVAANAGARSALGHHIIGQDARIALRHPDAMRLLDLGDGGSVTIRGLTGTKSLWKLTRHRIDDRLSVIELADRTSEADISRAHTDFVANASHELRTPLSTIIGYVETLADSRGKVDQATAVKFHQTVLREAKRMQNLVSDLMSLSQLVAEKHDMPTEEVDLGRLVARVAAEVGTRLGENRVKLALPDRSIMVNGDAGQLEQLLHNLIDNAFKYGDSDQGIDVTVEPRGERLARVVVSDYGMGIASEHLPHLTRRFYRTDPGRSRAGGGTGLGLAIVKHIVERHRGKLDIASTLGQGTTITVDLPMVLAPAVALS